ncbi:INO80 complex subunit E [Dryobates pubescens]|uniref:INO80 complex subunit E n=1 Tax=Dryobates pubescens TaxID=118200 RepID=UPI0023B9FC68|nr:INO80 complex subunit E [Dryobates pubescens]
MNGAAESDGGGGYKRRYRALKRRLKLLLYEQECFQEELRRAQRKLLKVSRDKSFLLDRLLQYEAVDDDSSDSEATASSENSDGEGAKGAEAPPAKRKRSPSPATPSFPSATPTPYMVPSPPSSPFPAQYLAPEGPRPARPRPGPTRRPQKGARRLQLPLAPPLPFPGGRVCGGPLPSPAPAPPKAPPPVPSTVPKRLLSDGGDGSDQDGLDGDDELVIDIPDG